MLNSILIVEDSKTINNVLKVELEKLDYTITQAFSFKQAKELLDNNRYKLIVLDLHLPDGEGYELIDSIKSLTDTKVIVLTSSKEEQLREELFHYGILDYIIKDKNILFSIQEIDKIIQKIDTNQQKKALIIDDSTFICKQIKTVLEPRDYDVTFAKTAKDGLDLINNQEFDIVILDMELPDIHGLEVLKKVRSNIKNIDLPIVVLSGTATPDMIRAVLKGGGNDFLKKPFIVEEFVLKIDLWVSNKIKDKTIRAQSKELAKINDTLEDKIKEATKKVIKQEKVLQEQSRLAQMGEMLSMIAHQWRQPLGAISSSVMSIQSKLAIGTFDFEDVKDRDKFLKFLEQKLNGVNGYVKFLTQTIEDFRNFFKPSTKKEKVSICKPISKALNIVENSIESNNIKISFSCDLDAKLNIHSNEIMQVILNILQNAKDSIVEKNIIDGKIDIEVLKQEDNFIIKIYDNGGGIPEDILPKIFDPYFSTKASKNGTGLGLYMSKIIIEEHHKGKLSVANTKDGACFKIILKDFDG